MKRLKLNTSILSLMSISLLSLGFSTWIINNGGNSFFNVDVNSSDLYTKDMLTFNGASSFNITRSGILKDETFVESSGVIFNFTLDTTLLDENITSINYHTDLTIKNTTSSIVSYLDNPFLEVNDNTNLYSDPIVSSSYNEVTKEETISKDIVVNDITKGTIKDINIKYIFKGNFYDLIIKDKDIGLHLSLEAF